MPLFRLPQLSRLGVSTAAVAVLGVRVIEVRVSRPFPVAVPDSVPVVPGQRLSCPGLGLGSAEVAAGFVLDRSFRVITFAVAKANRHRIASGKDQRETVFNADANRAGGAFSLYSAAR
jgi:hypothetical protein